MLVTVVIIFLLLWLFFGVKAAVGFARFIVGTIVILTAAIVIAVLLG